MTSTNKKIKLKPECLLILETKHKKMTCLVKDSDGLIVITIINLQISALILFTKTTKCDRIALVL